MPRSFIKNVEFKEIRDGLRQFLEDPEINPEFTDIDFEGSNINVIINLLAYAAHHHALYSNLVLNESFLRTAHTRASVVSRAKDLNYTPRSYTAATMIVDLTLRDLEGDPTSHTLTRGSKFVATVDGEEIPFVVAEDVTATNDDGEFRFEDLRLRQGKMRTFRYTVNSENRFDLFEIPDEKADVSLLRVRVRDSAGSTNERTFRRDTNIVDQDRRSPVYYLQEGPNGKYQIEFGDNIISRALEDGNVIKLDWVSTKGRDGNGAASVRPTFNISGGYDYDIEVKTPAFGGDGKENIDSIKFTAPKHWAAQNRIVTVDDYYVALKENVGDIRDIKVWGGEDNDPPQYGKVFIVLETEDQIITRGAARDIDERILRPRRMPTVITEFVEPNYIHPNLTLDVMYDATLTSRTRGSIIDLIEKEAEAFIEDEGRKFGARFFLSELENDIKALLDDDDEMDMDPEATLGGVVGGSRGNPIRSVTTDLTLTIQRQVPLNQSINIEFDFGNEIEPESITSNRFTAIERFQTRDSQIADNGRGGLFLFDPNTGQRTSQRIGDVNYSEGKVTITDLRIEEIFQNLDGILLTVEPENKRDIRGERKQIFRRGDYQRNVLANVPNPLEINLSIL